ncbi:uncharacterized protein LOC107263170 isoform X2 [Cephus cinctus]|uniref:Uncharacterized protein LOC107263170 isoform X2 n=1 Tax=Cephus cinctus TaxID=211228 RepID=A0AAJ7R8N6_CEPCN|nr:uncharacterized protein LOC107263170 isoform X2 [Cephus cinctus]
MMLEPLLVLTVLNCFFMFSSTVTTCALWWQGRKHRCYHGNAAFSHSQIKKSRSHSCIPKKSVRSHIDKIISFIGTDHSTMGTNKAGKQRFKNISKHMDKSKMKRELAKHHGVSKTSSTKCFVKCIKEEANQTNRLLSDREPRSKVVMEVATVQKVQIYDKDLNEPVVSSMKNVSSYTDLFGQKKCYKSAQKTRAAKSSENI